MIETTITLILAFGLILAYFKYKKKIGQELILAILISVLWVSKSGFYDYSGANNYFLGLNLFPLIAWTAGLVLIRELYEKVKWKNKLFKVSIVYIALLIILEYIGYNYAGIQLASNYKGLFGFELMHMPWWGQLYYLTIGLLFLKLTDYMRVR